MSRYEDLKKKYGIVGDATGNNVIPQRSSGSSKISDEKKKRADEIIGHATDKIQPSPIYDYTGASRKKGSAKQTADPDIEYDSSSVLKLGAGPLSNSAVTAGVASGALELTSQNKDGKYSVAKNKDYVAPKKTAQIIDRSPARKAELEAIKNPTQAQIEELAIIKNELAEREKIAKQKEKQQEIKKQYSIAAENEKSLEEAIDGMSPFWKGITRAVWGDSMYGGGSAKTTAGTQIPNDQTAQMSYSIASAAENTAASMINFAGVLTDLAMKGAQNQIAVDTAINAEQRGENFDEVLSKRMDMNKAANEGKKQAFSDIVDSMMQHSEELHQEAYRIAGDEGKFLVDLLYTGTQMAGDAAMNFILPGSGLGFMSMRVFGQSAYEARVNGADSMTQLMFGLKSAVIEYLTEKIGGGAFKKVYGVGIVDDAIESALGRLFKTDTGRTVIRYIINAVNEGNEEVLSDILNPVADRLLGLDEGEGALFTDEDLGQMWYDWMLGTALGGIGGTVNLASGSNTEQNASLRLTEAAQKALIESGLESAADTDSYKLAEKYQKTLDSGRLLSNSQVQKLTAANDMAIRSEIALQSATDAVRAAIPERAAQMFAERGERASPELISGVTKLVGEGMPTEAEIQAIEQSNNAPEVARQLTQEYIEQEAASEEMQEAAPVNGSMELWDANNIVESMFPDEVKSGILSAPDVADIQSYYDASGRSMDLSELEAMVRDYIQNKKEASTNEGRKQSSDGSMGRKPDVGPGEQAGGIQKSAGRDQSEKRGNDARGEETRRPSGKKPQREKISGKSLNIPHGTDSQKLTVVKPDGVNARIVNAFSAAAKSITLVNGAIEQQKNDAVITVTGLTTADGRVFARMDHRLYNGTKLLLHECGHLYMDDSAMRSAMHNAAADVLTGSKLEELANSYALLWKGLYKMPAGITTDEELADYFENNPDAYTEFLEVYEQEIWCDALAGLDRIKAAGASKLTDTVRSIFKDYTGIDVDVLLSGTETGNTTFRTELGKAERIAPRNNGPPMDRYSVETLPDGKKYVRAERQVIFSNDPEAWSEQLEAYINNKIRKGENVHLIAEDGDVLTITEDTAGKVSSRYKDGRTMSDEAFERKVSAGTHIDELAQVSVRGKKTVADAGNRHGAMASAGWNYRTAYFLDFDGKYYRCTISVSISKNGNAVYNIGEMEERSFPTAQKALSGSSANSGALGREASSQGSIRKSSEDVNSYSVDDAEQAEQNVKSAEKHFGTTYRIAEAGYLLTDGKLLDFSGKHDGAPGGYRTVDHRDIVDALGDDYGGDDYSGGMIRFMSEGNIRLSPESGGINLSVKPNKFQLATLDRYISSFRGEVILDIDDAAGNTVASIEYPRRTYSKKIIDAINAYFDDGIIPEQPEQSTTAMFHDSYSVDDNLEYELYEVYNGTFDASKNEVHIGTTSNFMTNEIGAEALELYMPAEKAYRAMKTEHQAIFEGKPYGENINYHGLGVDGLMDILKASENPIAAFVDTPSSNNKRENRIVLVTDVNADGGLGVVIEEVDTKALSNNRIIKANKAITVYPKSNVSSAIQEAIADNRILYLDEKRSQVRLAGMKGANYPTAARNADFANNIRSFWENVKWKKSGSNEYTAESSSDELPEWKKKLAQFGKESYSADDISYDSLVSKPDMRLADISDTIKTEDRKTIVEEGIKNVSNNGGITPDERTFAYVDDIGEAVFVSKASLRHGLDRRRDIQSPVIQRVGDILQNAILINKATPKTEAASDSFVLLGAGKTTDSIYAASFIVNRFTNEVETINVLYSASVKKAEAAAPSARASGKPLSLTASKISIADLLSIVNEQFADVLPASVLEHFGTARRTSEISGNLRYSVDDALLVESEPGYSDTLSKVRAEARRYGAGKLEERISNFDGRIKGYEETENRTAQMELELEDLRNRRKVYSDALKRKKAKNDELRKANETAKNEAKETAQRIAEAQGRNRSKQTLRDTIFRDFNIESGRADVGDTINAFADKYADQGRISRKDLDALFDALMERGAFIAEAEDYASELRAHLAGSSVRVPSYVKEEFGDDWPSFYRRAWGNKIYLKIDSGSNGIDAWTMELADAFGEGTFDTTADLKTQLERIVELAEQGRDEKMNLFQMADYVRRREGRDTADAIVDELYQKLETAVKTYASNAKLEMELTYKNAFQQAKDRAIRQEKARRSQERKDLSERQQRTLKQLQILKGMRDTTSKEFREEIDRVLEGIDTIAVSAANAMNYSKKYEATWESIADMYEEARANDLNFLEDTYIEKHLLPRIKGKHLDEMVPADLEQLYQAAVALRTKIYNTRNIIGSETNMLYSEAYDSIKDEMRSASKPKNRYGAKWKAMRYALNPNHYLEALAGWNPDSVWFKTFAQGLEDGERKMKRYVETSKQMLDEFVQTHKKWLETADGQGKDDIWYEVKVSPVAEWHKGDQPIFGEPITVYMTPLQKVHMYLESKNYDNLSHMLGGRVFADKELYSKGNKDEAFAADPIHLAPADVRRISSDLTEEEMELANILERYYNTYAKSEINKVSNELYGFDRAMAGNYAPIFTKDTYNTFTPAIIDGTAEGVGHMKTRIKGARTPTVNISAMDAFNKHVSQTSRFVGMSIPLHNMKAILNWTQNGKKMRSVIEQEWSKADLEYIEQLVTDLENPHFADEGYIEKKIDKIQSAYIGSVFGFNPSVALKVFGSFNLASAELGFENVSGAFTKVDPELIRKYTSEHDVRVRGYASPEVARLVNSQSKIEKMIQSNKFTKELFGGGLMIHTDAIVARAIWAWSEAAVRNENPDLEVGTQEQIDAGDSPFYKAVAERYNTAIGNTQSMYDIMHRSALLRDEGAVSRAFTMFHTDIMQAANLLIKAKGEQDYYRKALAADPNNKALQAKAAKYAHSIRRAAAGVVTSSMLVALVTVLNSLLKRRDDFYDENNKFMWDKFGEDYIIYVLKDFTGMIPIFDVAFGGLVDHLRGEKWYDVEVMGLSLFNDLVDKGIKVATKIIDGTATIEDYKKIAFLVAKRFGLPFDNVERYMLGLFSWVAPEIGEAYNNMISPPGKSDLKGKSGDVLERDIYDMYKQFGLDRETTDEIARLYEAGYDKIIMGSIPDSITINGVEYAIDDEAAEKYKHSRAEVLSLLSDVISSNGYQEADDETRNDMLKRLNSFAYETAKAAAVPEYDMAQWAESCQDLLELGEEIEAIALMPYTEKKSSSGSAEDNDPRYVKLIKAGVEYNNARDIEEKLTTLVPERGAKSVTQTQKVVAIAYMTIPEEEKSVAIELIYGTTGAKSFEKYKTATSAGLSSADYADFLTTLGRINDNSGVSQDEFKQAVRESGMPDYVAEQLWATYGWKKTYSRN